MRHGYGARQYRPGELELEAHRRRPGVSAIWRLTSLSHQGSVRAVANTRFDLLDSWAHLQYEATRKCFAIHHSSGVHPADLRPASGGRMYRSRTRSVSHTKTSLVGTSICVPITDGRLNLGTWQGEWNLDSGRQWRSDSVDVCVPCVFRIPVYPHPFPVYGRAFAVLVHGQVSI